MATPYCSKDQWAKRRGKTDWTTFATDENWPTADELQEALEDATNIMNDTAHINTLTNITDSNYTERLERICYNMANRMLDIEQSRGIQGANFGIQPWSTADFLISYERAFLISLSRIKSKRTFGKVVF